jgi:hypothetical protein
VECGQIFHEVLILGRSFDGEPAFGRHGEWAARSGRLQLPHTSHKSSTLQMVSDGRDDGRITCALTLHSWDGLRLATRRMT